MRYGYSVVELTGFAGNVSFLWDDFIQKSDLEFAVWPYRRRADLVGFPRSSVRGADLQYFITVREEHLWCSEGKNI